MLVQHVPENASASVRLLEARALLLRVIRPGLDWQTEVEQVLAEVLASPSRWTLNPEPHTPNPKPYKP